MNRNLGAFTSYGIEYIFDYLGEERIKQRIEELKKKKTGSMGIDLESFSYADSDNSYFDGKGVFWVFDLLIQWFDDIEFVLFLYENSKKYNEDNYFDGGILKKKWCEYIELVNSMIKRNPNKNAYFEVNKLNPYWMELHFFYRKVSKIFINEELINNYIEHFKEISVRIKQDFSSMPNTFVSNGLMWAICNYYEQKGNLSKANEMAKLNNTYLNIWREIPENDEEENEE
jgi:hypothetical protein